MTGLWIPAFAGMTILRRKDRSGAGMTRLLFNMQKLITFKKPFTISNAIKCVISLALLIALLVSPCQADDFLSSRVKDISDRKYEKAVIELLDNAKDSITVSMYRRREYLYTLLYQKPA